MTISNLINGIEKIVENFEQKLEKSEKTDNPLYKAGAILIKILLENPDYDCYSKELIHQIQSKVNISLNDIELLFNPFYSLKDKFRRKKWILDVKNTSAKLVSIIIGNSSDKERDLNHSEKFIYDRRDLPFQSRRFQKLLDKKAVLVALAIELSQNESTKNLSNKIYQITEKINTGQSRRLLSEIIDFLSVKIKSNYVKKERTAEIIKDLTELQNQLESKNFVKQENDDLRNALEMAKQEIEDLEEELQKIKDESKINAIVDFFNIMNSQQNGNLLDGIAQVEQQLKMLRSKGWQPSQEIESIPMIIRMFMSFTKKLGLEPIDVISDRKK